MEYTFVLTILATYREALAGLNAATKRGWKQINDNHAR